MLMHEKTCVIPIMSIDVSDIYHCYVDLWKGTSERFAMAYQGIGKDNMLKHRIGAADAATNEEDQAIQLYPMFGLYPNHMHIFRT